MNARSKKNKRKNPYADHALVDEKELIDDEEDEAKEEEEIQKLKERVHKRNYLVSFKQRHSSVPRLDLTPATSDC